MKKRSFSVTIMRYRRKIYRIPVYVVLCSFFVFIGINNEYSIVKWISILLINLIGISSLLINIHKMKIDMKSIENNKIIYGDIKSVTPFKFNGLYSSLNIGYLDDKGFMSYISTNTYFWKGHQYIGKEVGFIIASTNNILIIKFN